MLRKVLSPKDFGWSSIPAPSADRPVGWCLRLPDGGEITSQETTWDAIATMRHLNAERVPVLNDPIESLLIIPLNGEPLEVSWLAKAQVFAFSRYAAACSVGGFSPSLWLYTAFGVQHGVQCTWIFCELSGIRVESGFWQFPSQL